MAGNFVQDGATLNIVAAAALTNGTPVAIGSLLGVPLTNIANGATGSVRVEGVFTLPKATGVAFTQGQRVNFRPSLTALTSAAAATGDLVGAATVIAAAASGDTTCLARLSPGSAIVQP